MTVAKRCPLPCVYKNPDGWCLVDTCDNPLVNDTHSSNVPIRHGRWITALTDNNEFWANYCDQCNTYLPYGIEWRPNFCPNCGADMRLQEEGE